MAKHKPSRKPSLNDRVRHDPKLLERALKDPGLRSQLADKYLTKDQLASRRNHQMVENVGDITHPLSGDSLVSTARTLVDREFDPLEQDIGRQESAVERRRVEQQRRAGGYYSDLARQLGATVGGQEQAKTAAMTEAGQRGQQTLGAIDQSAGAAQQRAAQDAAVRGAAVQGDSMAELAAEQAQARMRAAQEGQAQVGAAQAFGDAQAAFLRGIQGATAQQGGEQVGQITARGDEALADLAASRAKLQADRKGQFTDTLLKMRGNEVDRYLTERGLANDEEKALLDYKTDIANLKTKAQIEAANRRLKARLTQAGLSQKEAQAEADRASREAIAASNNATSRANNQASNAQSDRNSRRSAANRGGIDRKSRVEAAAKRDDALQLAQSYRGRRASRATALQLLTEKYGSDFARVAVGAIYDGGAKPHLESLMKSRYGIDIPRQYRTR